MTKKKNSKLQNVILDLDQTLISAENYEYFVKGEKEFRKKYYKRDKQDLFKYVEMDKDYVVYSRPHLEEFLDWLFKNFNVSVWTAASKDYAMFIIDKVLLTKQDRKLDYVLFAYHCDISMDYNGNTKSLSMLWDKYDLEGYNKNNTVIIDDYEEVKDTQPNNCIHIKAFKFIKDNSENDTELQKTTKILEKYLKYGLKMNGNKN